MTRERWNAVLWVAFGAVSVCIYVLCSRLDAPDYVEALFAAGLVDAALAGALLWRHGLSLATPVVIIAYVVANKSLFFLLFLTVIFWPKAAP